MAKDWVQEEPSIKQEELLVDYADDGRDAEVDPESHKLTKQSHGHPTKVRDIVEQNDERAKNRRNTRQSK